MNIYIYIYIYIYKYIFIVNLLIPFIPSINLDDVFTYNHMALMSIRSRSHVNSSMVFTRTYHLSIYNYIRSLLNVM